MIKSLELKNVRLFSKIKFAFSKKIVIFIGNNAVGKTTILESIYFLCLTKSPRTINAKELIKHNEEFAKMRMKTNKEYIVVINERKRIFVNENEVKKYKDYIGINNVVMFSPNDLQLVYGSPTERRRFLDINISQLSKEYINHLSEYKNYLKQRNELLKRININDDMIFLNIITKKLIEEGKKVVFLRDKFIKEINENLTKIHNEKIEIIYQPSSPISKIEEIFENKREIDIITKTTNYGPHRDEVIFKLNCKDSSYCSQGQIRTIVLELKLTLIKLIKKYKKEDPIVLLDDVLSELDEERKNKLLNLIDDDYQVFITATDVLNIKEEILKKAQIINLKERGIMNE